MIGYFIGQIIGVCLTIWLGYYIIKYVIGKIRKHFDYSERKDK